MSLSFAGLVISSVPSSLYATLRSPSMFYATVFFVAALVFAYLTNPSESSFRAFLTEQSFRHHLTRLDDSPGKDTDLQDSGVYFTSRSHIGHGSLSHTRFHFANRASVALRTPSHEYHNFVFFTIALVIPSHKFRPECGSAFSDTWFLGAFGAWWRGGLLHAWWVDSVTRSRDEEVSRSGVLDIKNLDTVDQYNVLPFSSFQAKSPPCSPPKLRDQRQQHDSTNLIQSQPQPRSVTPPPLPKSVSLPLHATRRPSPIIRSPSLPQPFASLPNVTSVPKHMFDQSPAIAELLRQIEASRSEVHELRSQLVEFQDLSAQQRGILHQELEVHRERKREEDSARGELKFKTKHLDDAKRNAESAKRDVDRKLKNAEARRDEAVRKIKLLNAEILKSREKTEEDQEWIRREIEGRRNMFVGEGEKGGAGCLEEELDKKKVEIKVADDVVAALSTRAKELEDRVAEEKERLRRVVEEAHLRKLRQQEMELEGKALTVQNSPVGAQNSQDGLTWPPTKPQHTFPASSLHGSDRSLHSTSLEFDRPPQPSQLLSPRRKTLSLSSAPISVPETKDHRRTQTNFAPFDDSPGTPAPAMDGGLLTPTILIPSNLIDSLGGSMPPDMELSRSFQSADDPFVNRPDRSILGEWRGSSGSGGDRFMSTSPTSTTGPRISDGSQYETSLSSSGGGNGGGYFDPEFRPSQISATPASSHAMDLQRACLRLPDRTQSEPLASSPNEPVPPRRWFSVKERKPLNPQAEEFNLNNPSPQMLLKPAGLSGPYDALNPSTSLTSSTSSGASSCNATASSSFFYKAFAPSAAERAALGVGVGTLSGSLERLPSLSDVGSLNTSPAHVHAAPAAPAAVSPAGGESSFSRSMAWLNSLPRRKPRFSPWEDDEH